VLIQKRNQQPPFFSCTFFSTFKRFCNCIHSRGPFLCLRKHENGSTGYIFELGI